MNDRDADARQRVAKLSTDDLPGLRNTTIGSTLYKVLEAAILDNRLEPGQRLHVDDLARQFEVSRIPVREALQALDANGWIEIRRRQGTYVVARTEAELEALFETRCLIEPQAARLAARRRTDDDLIELGELVEAGREAVEGTDVVAAARVNEQFHCVIARATSNSVLRRIAEGIAKRTRFYFSQAHPERVWASVEEHAQLVSALRDRDGDAAASIGLAHITRTQNSLTDGSSGS